MFVSLVQACVVYIVKKVASFQGLGQLRAIMAWCVIERVFKLYRPAGKKLLVETGTNSCSTCTCRCNTFLKFYKNIYKVDIRNKNYNSL